MTKGLRWRAFLALVVIVAAAGHGCGTNHDKRDRERCEQCDPAQIDHECVDQCVRFCVPGDPDCADRCKAELECRQCTTGCTGTVARCAPADEPLVCEDGTF